MLMCGFQGRWSVVPDDGDHEFQVMVITLFQDGNKSWLQRNHHGSRVKTSSGNPSNSPVLKVSHFR
jgi:hypothetical protein